ncbi:polyketide product template domain-containing protein isoform 2 [Cladophialophora immunda]|nr:polyketide product template domain-containing protein isoform 2 [Cladophialophora immunda]
MEAANTMPPDRTVFVFGDITDPWADGLDQLYKQAVSTPWLKSFLDELAGVVRLEAKSVLLDRALRDSLGHFSSLAELGEKYRHATDEFGLARAILLHAVRAGFLLQWVQREPHLVGPDAPTEWLGLSGGLLTASALAVADTFETLYDALLQTARLVVRVCKVASVRSRAVEDQTGAWGWAVLGIAPNELSKALGQFQQGAGIPVSRRANVSVTGNGWSTVIGPPSVLKLFFQQCPAVRNLAHNPTEIKSLQHTLAISAAEINAMVGDDAAVLGRPLRCTNHALWGMDDPETSYPTWGDLLRAVCDQVLARPLDITQVVGRLVSKSDSLATVRIIQPGSCSHAPYLATALKTAGRNVLVRDQHSLLDGDDTGPSLMAGRIAIVGMAGRGPKSDNVDQFWEVIMSKQDTCTEIPKDRFDIDDYYCPAHERGDQRCKMETRHGCFMDNPGHFDSRFFHVSPREALLMDPNHRQFLMSTYEALEMAGYSDGQTRTTDPNRIAAFYAQATDDWHKQTHPSLGCDSYTLQGIQRAFGAGRLAFSFKWEGPTYSLDSACAGTTACVHLACLSLLSNDVDMAVAGAANILNWPHSFTCLDDSGILSHTGNCKAFRDDADGYARADFVGAVVLKRLEDAVAHNDNILAVVASSGRNHSGNSTSITTSDAGAQERLFRKIMRNAQVTPDDISYVEMHGTGTQTGDPAEVGAVSNTFKNRRPDLGPVFIGGVKANVGHGEAAAGMAELLKSIMMFKHDIVPPQAGMPHALNPKFPPLKDLNIDIPSEPREFKKHADKPRRILLNNFDAAGGNACLLLEDYDAYNSKEAITDPRTTHVVAVSARTKAAFEANKRKLAEFLRANPATRLQDVAYTTTARRMQHPLRFATPATSIRELVTKLESTEPASSVSKSQVVFVYTGQGSHYAGMGAELYRTSSVFRDTIDLCVAICENNGFPSFLDIITNSKTEVSTKDTAQIQLAVVALEISLTAFWRSAGLEAAMVMGHSLGEYAALHAAGVLSLADTLYLVGSRALMLLERCEAGSCAMLALSTSVATVQHHLAQNPASSCTVACINSPNATVISGTLEDVEEFRARITGQDAKTRGTILSIPFAMHSFQMDPIVRDYTTLAGGVAYSAPKIPVASTLLASAVNSPNVFNQDYLAQQTRQPVDFVGALKAVGSKLKDPVWLEIGPGPVCTSFVRATLSPPGTKCLHSIDASSSNWTSISQSLSLAYMAGVEVDWLAFHQPYESGLQLLTLPLYAWDMKDYWITFEEHRRIEDVTEESKPEVIAAPFITTCAQYLVTAASSPKIQLIFRATISHPSFLGLIDGHRMQHIGLASGSVFCDAALSAAKYTIEYNGRKGITARNLTVHDPELLAPLTKSLVGVDGELLTVATMKDASSSVVNVTFEAKSVKGASHHLGSMRVEVSNPQETQAAWDRMSYFIKAKADERINASKEGLGHRMRPEVFYALFANAVEFDPAFQGVQEAYVAKDFQEAAAIVCLKEDPARGNFTFSPYWSEALVHLAGFMVNGNPNKSSRTTFIVMGFESVEQTIDFECGKTYLTYTRINRWEKDTAFCDAYVFDYETSRLVMQCINLRYQELPKVVWKTILEGHHPGGSKENTAAPRKATTKENKKVEATSVSTPSGTPATKVQQPQQQAASSGGGLFQLLVESIAKSTGMDASELTPDMQLADLGVDSIMSIEVASMVRAKTGEEIPATFILDYPTVGDLLAEFGDAPADPSTPESPAAQPGPEPDPASSTSSAQHSTTTNPSRSTSSRSINTSASESFVKIEKPIATPNNEAATQRQDTQPTHDNSPLPRSISTYIHLPAFKSKLPVYGVDSPFLRCPSRLTPEVGMEGVGKYVVDALVMAQPTGSFMIGGFSAGTIVAYEVARQLLQRGRKVDGLLLIDLCCPRPATGVTLTEEEVNRETDVGIAVFGAAAAAGDDSGMWTSTGVSRDHLRAYLLAMRLYHPPAMKPNERPGATAIIWAERGMTAKPSEANVLIIGTRPSG